MKKTFKEIQDEVISKYRIKINEHSTCYRRTHAHVKTRTVCKWKRANSVKSTWTLFHEIGHVETTTAKMRRAESEYYATCWAIDRFKEYGLPIPQDELHIYQRYVLLEVARGKRRGGTNYDVEGMNLYEYAGIPKTIEEFKEEIESVWIPYINAWI